MKITKITSKYLRKGELESLNGGEVTKKHRTFSGAVNHVKKYADGGCGTVYFADEVWSVYPDFNINEALQMIE